MWNAQDLPEDLVEVKNSNPSVTIREAFLILANQHRKQISREVNQKKQEVHGMFKEVHRQALNE